MNLDNYNPFKPHLFIDSKEQVIYYNYINKLGYYIPKDKMNKYYAFSNRFMIAILSVVLLVNTFLTLEMSILAGIILELVMGFFFYKRFLPELRKNDKLSIDKLEPYKRSMKKDEFKPKQIIKVVLYFLFSILLVLNAFDQQMLTTNPIVFYLSVFFAGAVFIFAIYSCVQLMKK